MAVGIFDSQNFEDIQLKIAWSNIFSPLDLSSRYVIEIYLVKGFYQKM